MDKFNCQAVRVHGDGACGYTMLELLLRDEPMRPLVGGLRALASETPASIDRAKQPALAYERR